MFHKKPKDAIIPYSNNNNNISKIKPDLDTGLTTDILEQRALRLVIDFLRPCRKLQFNFAKLSSQNSESAIYCG